MAQIYFSEVMFDLDGSDSPNEFIEIYNAELSINESGAKTGLLSWDGKNQHGNSVKTGQYLLHLEVKNVYNQSTWETIERIIVVK